MCFRKSRGAASWLTPHVTVPSLCSIVLTSIIHYGSCTVVPSFPIFIVNEWVKRHCQFYELQSDHHKHLYMH